MAKVFRLLKEQKLSGIRSTEAMRHSDVPVSE